ncbi:hypothetical protein F5B22DRAFT_376519 [Xylaria bambusicola]|uniref:uncharacterized protein n=1 Tax=Xylaria bambusicola TaxID=326684 RepID=UPI002007A49A|nr:uncharacterized protein F5B22DRAFT_376519 [Xylaria bambusicola]KAI0509020.1 hypothetical protein F5B22DRAFT_376519 [Xylaria bambusicola]
MLPSRGLARNPAIALRYASTGWAKPTRITSTRQFSQARSQSSVLARHGQISPSITAVRSGATIGIASSVFAQRSGATRNLSLWPSSLWPFYSKPQTSSPETVEPPQPPPSEPPAAAAQSPLAETSPSPFTPDEPASNSTPDLSQLTEDILREFDPQSFVDVPQHIGFLSEMGLDFGWGTTTLIERLLEFVHIYSGMPWWGSIAAVAVLFRLAVFYPTLVGAKHSAKLQKVQANPEFKKAYAEMQEAAYRTKDRQAMMVARSHMNRIKSETGASAWKPFIGLAAIPFSFGMFRLIRGMANIPVPGMETGGLAWFTDLTVHDPFFILPIAGVGLGSLTLIFTQRANVAQPTSMQHSMMQGMKYILPPLMFVGTAWLPAGLQWFFLWVSAGTVIQGQATLNPTLRRWVGLDPLLNTNNAPAVRGASTFPPGAGIQYQSPSTRSSLKSGFRDGIASATKSFKEATGATEERQKWQKADEYEDKRALEEKQKAFRRMEEVRRRRAERQH